jgi:hypothetical protein
MSASLDAVGAAVCPNTFRSRYRRTASSSSAWSFCRSWSQNAFSAACSLAIFGRYSSAASAAASAKEGCELFSNVLLSLCEDGICAVS